MCSFMQLRKNCKEDMSMLPKYRLALIADCATQHMAFALKGCAYIRNLCLEVFDADYNQIHMQAYDKNSEMYKFDPDAVLIFMCTENLYAAWCETPYDRRQIFAEMVFKQIHECWDTVSSNCPANILQFTFAEYDDFIFGNYGCKHKASFIYQLRKLNMLLMEGCTADRHVFLIDLCGIQTRLGRERIFDAKLYYNTKMPISLVAMPIAAASVIDTIKSLCGTVMKCVVVDLDNTLWGGIVGDDGLSNIQIGELGIGRVFSEFQAWLRELKKRGVLLVVCSKNDETIAREPFLKHHEMLLKLDDFALFVANWEDKATNIRKIQQTLNIGMDSMIFIDDSPFERDLVRSLIPEIIVPELPDDPADYISYMQSLNLFEVASFSDADTNRTNQYRLEAQRDAIRLQYEDYDEYLQSLEMKAKAEPFSEFYIPRIVQLTQRSNQFNLRTVRYTEMEIIEAAKDPNRITLYFTLKDKFSDYDLISVAIMQKQSNRSLFIETWLLSCRVLKRGMEEFIINKIVDVAKQNGFATITGEYIRTPKNSMVADIYEKLGLMRTNENTFVTEVSSFKYNKTHIKEETQ